MKKIVAITTEGKEFIFSARSAHSVPVASCEKICQILNKAKYKLNSENEKWFTYEIDQFDSVNFISETQSFRIRKGIVYRRSDFEF